MYIKKLIIVVLIFALGLSLYGCGAIETMKGLVSKDEPDVKIIRSDEDEINTTEDSDLRDTVLYYQNENGYLVPVKRQIPWEEGIAKAALRNMMDTPVIREDIGIIGLKPLLPAGTEIMGMSINQDTGVCKLDFNEQVMDCQSKKEEENLVKGVVYTLTEFPNIQEVQIIIDGKVVSEMRHGTKIKEPLKREDINVVDSSAQGSSKIMVYYKGTSNGEYEYYVPVTVPTSAPNANVLTALEELFNGAPELSGLYSDIPNGVVLQGVEVDNGIAYVDVQLEDEDIISDQTTFDNMSKNIGLTLNQFSDISYVEVLIDGQTLEEAGLDLTNQDTVPVFANEY
jgi:germination protein M